MSVKRRQRASEFVACIIVLAACACGVTAQRNDVIELDLGGSQTRTSVQGGTQFYSFKKSNDVPQGVETIILRVTREVSFSEEEEFMRLCLGENATPADCKNSTENFEIWVDYTSLDPYSIYYVGVYTSISLKYTIRACISTCAQSCAGDCNGKFVPSSSSILCGSVSLSFHLVLCVFTIQWRMCGW